jgi:hypothetical protein
MEIQITPVKSRKTADQGQPQCDGTVAIHQQPRGQCGGKQVKQGQLILRKASRSVVDQPDARREHHDAEKQQDVEPPRHEQQHRYREHGNEEHADAHRLADALVGIDREGAAAVARQVLRHARNADDGHQKCGARPKRNQQHVRPQKPQRAERGRQDIRYPGKQRRPSRRMPPDGHAATPAA